MAMNSTTKRKLNKQVTRVAALAMTCVIGISSAFTVAALTKKITVVDGDNQIAVSTLNTNTAVSYTHLYRHPVRRPAVSGICLAGKLTKSGFGPF